jgi:hypothetical protein
MQNGSIAIVLGMGLMKLIARQYVEPRFNLGWKSFMA